jgi:hypothetical protein
MCPKRDVSNVTRLFKAGKPSKVEEKAAKLAQGRLVLGSVPDQAACAALVRA